MDLQQQHSGSAALRRAEPHWTSCWRPGDPGDGPVSGTALMEFWPGSGGVLSEPEPVLGFCFPLRPAFWSPAEFGPGSNCFAVVLWLFCSVKSSDPVLISFCKVLLSSADFCFWFCWIQFKEFWLGSYTYLNQFCVFLTGLTVRVLARFCPVRLGSDRPVFCSSLPEPCCSPAASCSGGSSRSSCSAPRFRSRADPSTPWAAECKSSSPPVRYQSANGSEL